MRASTPMRLAYIHNHYIPSRSASSLHAMKMCQAFTQEGYLPTLFGFRPAGDPPDLQALFYQYGIRQSFDVKLLRIYEPLRRHDFAIRAARQIKHQHFPFVFSRSLLAALWTTLLGLPTIFEEHQPAGTRLGKYYFELLVRQKAFMKLVVITDVLKDAYLAHYPRLLTPEQIIIEADAVDLEQFNNLPTLIEARRQLALPESECIAGYSGSLYQGRGIELIFELAKRLLGVHFLIVGGTEQDLTYWKAQLQPLQLHNVTLAGFIPNAKLPVWLAACNVLLMPYERKIAALGAPWSTDPWFSPLKMFEYMAAKRPMISSDLPILHRVLNVNNTIFCTPEVADEWEHAIRLIMESPALGEKLAKQARQDVEYYTWRKRVQRLMAQINL